MLALRPYIAVAARAWPHALVLGAVTLVALGLHLPLIHTELDYEDGEWLRGSFPGYRSRVLQVLLMHRLLMPLFTYRVEGYYLFALLLHLLTAAALYATLLTVARCMRTGLRAGRWPVVAGAGLASIAFASHQAGSLTFLSGMSYQLFCLFGLLTVTLSLAYLERGGTWRWVLGVLCAAAALLSHSYALGLPLFIAALELCRRRSFAVPVPRWNLVWRYALHLLPLWLFATQLSTGLTANRLSPSRAARHLIDPEVLGVDLLHFANYLEIAAVTFVQRSAVLARLLPVSFPGPDLHWSADRLVTGAALLLLLLGGLWTLALRRRAGLCLVGLLFVWGWSGMTFHQTLLVGYDDQQGWRYYHNAAGLCLVGGAALAWGFDLLVRRLNRRAVAVVMGAALAGCFGAWLAADTSLRGNLAALLSGELSLKSAYTWDPHRRCAALVPTSIVELEEALNNRGTLTCRDLSGLDLSERDLRGLDLSGADLTGARLSMAALDGARLSGASLGFAALDKASLRGADLRGVNLTGANLGLADLTEARLKGAVLVGTFLYNIRMRGLTEDEIRQRLEDARWKGGAP